MIDRTMLDSFLKLDIDTLIVKLGSILKAEELAAMKQRFLKLRAHANGLSYLDLCVDNWNTWRTSNGSTAPELLTLCEEHPAEASRCFQDQHAKISRMLDMSHTDDQEALATLVASRQTLENLIGSLSIVKQTSYLGALLR